MAHGFENSDTMFSVREVPWHGLGQVVEEAPTAKEAIQLAGLDWKVGKYPIQCNGVEVEGKYGLIREDTNGWLGGPVTDQYRIVQNEEGFQFMDSLVGRGLVYETAGSIFEGKKVFMTAKLQENLRVADDQISTYLLLSNGHSGIDSLQIAITPVRVVCNNTLQLALRNFKRKWAVVHSARLEERVEEARKALELTGEYMLNFVETGNRLVDKKLTDEQLDKCFEIAFQMGEERRTNFSTMRKKMDAFYKALEVPDLKPYAGTAWSVVNAVSDIETHQKNWSADRLVDAAIEGNFKATADIFKYVMSL